MHSYVKVALLAAALAITSLLTAATATAQVPVGLDPDPSGDLTLALPGLTTGDVTVLGPSTARVSASVDPNGTATSFFVEYGTNGAYNLRTPSISVGAGADPSRVVADLLDLQPGESYSYRLVAESLLGTTITEGGTFTTAGPVSVDPATGRPTAAPSGQPCTITGTDARDDVQGTAGDDVICVLGGADRVNGGAGNDKVYGGDGADRINGGAGSDRLEGNGGNDVISGGGGNDRVVGHKGRDRLSGGSGRDHMISSLDHRGGDRVNGGRGRDRATVNKRDRVRRAERIRRRR